jgi:hypothetical protein
MPQMWTFPRGIATAPPQTRRPQESWKIHSIDASLLLATTKGRITHINVNGVAVPRMSKSENRSLHCLMFVVF